MGTSTAQDAQFVSSVISSTLLEESIDWIVTAMSPDEIFPQEALEEWAKDNGYTLSD